MNADRIVKDLKVLTRDAEDLLRATADDVSDKAKEARSRLKLALGTARETCRRAQEKTVAAAKATDDTIREYPYRSLGVALGVGMLIGALAMRRNHD